MKFLFLKTLLFKKDKDEGFTLPMVIAIGMVMVLLSAVNLVQSGEENLNAIGQEGSSDALAIAELGISRYRNYLNQNRVLAVNNLDQWVGLNGETCSNVADTGQGWANDDNDGGSGYIEGMWREIEVDETVVGSDLNNDGDSVDTNAEIGRYKIVNYIYDNDGDLTTDNNGDINLIDDISNIDASGNRPRGILTVQGRDLNGSVAQIQVTIPLGVNPQDLENLNPAIWINQSNISNFGSVDVNGANVVLYRPSGSGGCDDPSDFSFSGTPQRTISDSRNLPPLVSLPSPPVGYTKIKDLVGDISTDTTYFDTISNTALLGTLDTTLHIKNESEENPPGTVIYEGDDKYYYQIAGNLEIDSGENIETDGLAEVVIFINGDLNITGNVDITNTSAAATSKHLEIHVTGNVNITGPGTVNIDGLIHAPNGTVSISGGADVNITGSVFANNWDNTSSGIVNITTDDYQFYTIATQRTPAPKTFRISGWQTEEATNF